MPSLVHRSSDWIESDGLSLAVLDSMLAARRERPRTLTVNVDEGSEDMLTVSSKDSVPR